MNAFDRLINPAWPNPTDGPAQRARAIARMYRTHLRAQNTRLCDQADEVAAEFGETWMLEREQLVEPEQEVTTAEAAELVHVQPHTIRQWATAKHPEDQSKTLLPRFGRRGKETLYLAGAVLEAALAVRRAQQKRTQSLH
ncbi:hypothetical protein BDK92_7278 [Micromonospora pisi]|uniref:Helix-turn-helix protein n=1 Tax=Micromonospora pisi TaxID=589240 RepID=A0A495JUW3_9ACTN|nr:hypothetical protein [Micromonospora pisi]RKR92796.1 hypothetical protein BDK92_7278 [Micromonospora pisi]